MKYLMYVMIALFALTFTPIVPADEHENGGVEPPQCPAPEDCGYTSRVTYEILGPDGEVVDRTMWQNFIGTSWVAAFAIKYATLAHIFNWREGEAAPDVQQNVFKAIGTYGGP